MSVSQALETAIVQATDSHFGLNKRVVLFGGDDCSSAAAQIETFVARELKARIVETVFVSIASAGTFGLRLSDGRTVFLKLQVEYSREELEALHGAQEALREKGVPAARRILPPTDFNPGVLASVHAFRDRGEKMRPGQKGCIEAAASGLATLNRAAREAVLREAVPMMGRGRSHPFNKLAPGVPEPPKLPSAERAKAVFDRVMEAVRAVDMPLIVSHTDWASRNLRFAKGQVSSIFDFEALRRGPEPLFVGQAAILFINEPEGVSNPAAAAAHFIRCYEKARGMFDDEESAAVDTGAALAVARYCHAAVRSEEMTDEEAPRIFEIFMTRFRKQFGRPYTLDLQAQAG